MRRALPLILSVAVLAVGCGDDGEAPRTEPADAAPPAPSAPETNPSPDVTRFRGRLLRLGALREPVAMAFRSGDDGLYFAQKSGQVIRFAGGRFLRRPVLDISTQVSLGFEQGLLGLAFSPDGDFLYINYTDIQGDTHVTEYAMTGNSTDPGSARDVLFVDQPYSNHNGGQLAFGSDGFLYIGLGDGGGAGDPMDHAQNLDSLLGKVLRIDPRPTDGTPYGIPTTNPFVGQDGARPEIWVYGLRNPWRFSFDRSAGDMWIGDAGQQRVEEINLQARPAGGENFGWDGYEGTLVYEEPLPSGVEPPVYEYGRELGQAVIGGYVYRGSEIPDLQGAYVFGDFYNPNIRALVPSASGGFREASLGLSVPSLSAFGEDEAGELYVMSLAGPVYRISF